MDHVIVMKVVDGFENLLDRLGSVFLCKLAVFTDAVKKLSPRRQLCHYIVFVLYSIRRQYLHTQKSSAAFNTLDSNQSWNRTMFGCFILCSRTISS